MRQDGTLRLSGTKEALPYNLKLTVQQAAEVYRLEPLPNINGLVVEHAMLCRDNAGLVVQLDFAEHLLAGVYHMRTADDTELVVEASETLYLYVSPILSMELLRVLQSTMRWLLNL